MLATQIEEGGRSMSRDNSMVDIVDNEDGVDWSQQDWSKYEFIVLTIGDKGHLTRADRRLSARVWKRIPHSKTVLLTISGYDDDPRELWQIPEVCAYVHAWAMLVEVTPDDSRLHRDSLQLLAHCVSAHERRSKLH